MKTSRSWCRLVLLAMAAGAGCHESTPPRPAPIGEALAELGEAERARFAVGQQLFNHVFQPEEGLGPLFNDNQCSACHTFPATGGTGDQELIRVARFEAGKCDVLAAEGGENVRIFATPQLKEHGITRQPEPRGTHRSRFIVPYLFGLGLVDAIPEDQILARADPDDRNGDGISGRPGIDANGRFARFGRKADIATLRDFVENAAHLEMGLTTPNRPRENTAGIELPEGADPVSDPELNEQQIELLVDFVRFLTPPPRRMGESEDDYKTIVEGDSLFRSIGCTACHVPNMKTGRSSIPALDRKQIYLYSDLLLHDMGADLVNVCSYGASPSELRTEPLMGLGHRERYLHDGRTRNLNEAIMLHGGEATAARERFRGLNELQRAAVLRFLRSL